MKVLLLAPENSATLESDMSAGARFGGKRSINYTSRQRSQRGIMSLRDSNRIQ